MSCIRSREHPCPNHSSVRVPRADGDQSIHAQTIIPFVFQEHTLTGASIYLRRSASPSRFRTRSRSLSRTSSGGVSLDSNLADGAVDAHVAQHMPRMKQERRLKGYRLANSAGLLRLSSQQAFDVKRCSWLREVSENADGKPRVFLTQQLLQNVAKNQATALHPLNGSKK